jgi:plastocyanin
VDATDVHVDDGLAMTWRRLLRWSGITALVVYVLVMLSAKSVIPPLVVIGIVIAVGLFLLRRPGRAGVIVMLVGLVIYVLSNLMFASGDLGEWRSFPSFVLIATSLVAGLVGIVAAIATLRGDRVSGAARAATLGAAAAVVGLLAVNALATITYDDPPRGTNDVALVAKDVKYTPASLTAHAGPVTFYVDNHDAVLHNLHVKKVGSFTVPSGHAARKTFDLAPGTYEFVCDFHDTMKGTLTVS